MMSLTEKIVAEKQKRNLLQLQEQLSGRNLESSISHPILYPESSCILKAVLENIDNRVWEKNFYTWPSTHCENELIARLSRLSNRENTVLCFFPNYSPRADGIISDLPVLEVLASKIDEWYKLAKSQDLHFFLCSSKDLREGIALDIYEADPVVHGTTGAVSDLYFWNR
ncbi:hypothetical protein [Pseudoduganella armeniaca]|uniref:hypothetical protein n=1 Tax=Pseudoduganella armeniaca TaxID=2072590 RepID=UPI0011B231B7|nr:hypothetical protein [Pseudoduganella armeniaca]